MSDQPTAVTKSFKINFERVANDLAAKVNEMEAVLAWSSENVLFARFVGDPQNLWFVDLGIVHPIRYHAPTLYEALHAGWENREKGEVKS